MSVKDFFKKGQGTFVRSPAKSLDELGREVESEEYTISHKEDKNRFIPHVDFSTASNFAKYGLAEQYYDDSIKRIYKTYPYDGSLKEKTEWHLSSSYLDKYIFDKEYPRTNGYAHFSADGWGTLQGSILGGYGAPASTDFEFIQVKGGPNVDADAKNTKELFPGLLDGKSNIYDVSKNQKSNLALKSENGFTVEFWLKKDAFTTTKTEKEVIFDLWNGAASSSVSYGRLTIELTGVASGSPFLVTAQSGTKGYFQQSIGSSVTTGSLTEFKHYAFTFVSSSSNLQTKFYVNGNLDQTLSTGTPIDEITGSLIANIGSLRTAPSASTALYSTYASIVEGYGKFSGSIDEFRYWTKKRTSQDIGRNWFTQINGGTNTDYGLSGTLTNKYNEENLVDLGVYYKFNEGITQTASTDSTVLDYSGRISNGTWTGYDVNSRSTQSAIVLAGAAPTEFKDPIIYSYHPDVVAKLRDLKAEGKNHDKRSNSSIYNSLPHWIIEEDEEKNKNVIKKLTQILSSYFDTLHLQAEELPELRNVDYPSASFKPHPFTERMLNNHGFDTSEIFSQATDLELLADRSEDLEFSQKLFDIKNTIYKNIYNNLNYIYKAKGTEKSFRNLFRCFGVDDELVRLNLYADNVTHELRDNYRTTAHRKKYISFNDATRHDATVYQQTSSGNANSTLSYISGSDTATGGTAAEFFLPWTIEAEVIFPFNVEAGLPGHDINTFQSSSLFGNHEARHSVTDFTWATGDNNNFQVYAVREDIASKNVKFLLTSSLTGWPTLETGFYEDVYDNEKWNLAVRFYIDKTNNGGSVKGGILNDTITSSGNAITAYVEFYGVNSVLDHVVHEFHLSGALTVDGGVDPENTANKRLYIGAHRTNFTGSVLKQADTKISSVRYWKSYLSNDTIKAHARDASNFGTERPYENIGLTKTSLSGTLVPSMDSLSLHWDFNQITGSDAAGQFIVEDYSSGSVAKTSRYKFLGNIVGNQHAGQGFGFPVSSTGVVVNEFVNSAKQRLPEIINSNDMVSVLSRDDEIFTREKRPIQYFHAIEKSMYQTISEEMINIFATIVDFNNLIGEPVNRYRQDYKDMAKIRQLFFERIGNTPDLEKYINFYKWVDSSISKMVMQLAPASANMSEGVRNLVESHILERNKYWTKYPTLEFKKPEPEVAAFGITELLYSWKRGHAPLTNVESDNCFWWSERADAGNSVISSSVHGVNIQRNTFNAADKHRSGSAPVLFTDAGVQYAGSTYAINRFSKPYRLETEQSRQIYSGVNFHRAKKLDYVKIATEPFGHMEVIQGPVGALTASVNYLLVQSAKTTTSPSVLVDDPTSDEFDAFKSCDDVIVPNEKRKYTYNVRNSREHQVADGYSFSKGDISLPFNIHSSSVTTGYAKQIADSEFGQNIESPVDFTNIHVDAYGYDKEVPLQGTFTEKFVGGHQHRHIALNKYDSSLSTSNKLQDDTTRPEAWFVFLGQNDPAFALVGPTYSTLDTHDKDTPRATRMRIEYAKRPVNIRNIQQTTGSGIGNYETNWNLVSTTGRTQNNAYFKENGGVSLPDRFATLLPATTNVHTLISIIADGPTECAGDCGNYFGVVIDSEGVSTGGRFVEQNEAEANIFTLPRRDLTGSNSVIVSRFSAPGGPEISSRGYLDIAAEEYSVHNALPFRNLSVRGSGSGEQGTIRMSIVGSTTRPTAKDREGLRTRLTRHCGKHGYDSQYGDPEACFHKVNRNSRKRIKEQ